MDRLFIIGNGFDLAHGIKSEYKHFRKYLIKTLKKRDSYLHKNTKLGFRDNDLLYEIINADDIDDSLIIRFLLYFFDCCEMKYNPFIGKKKIFRWNDFEKSLGNKIVFDDIASDYKDLLSYDYSVFDYEYDCLSDYQKKNILEELTDKLCFSLEPVKEYFYDWIKGHVEKQIITIKTNSKFENLLQIKKSGNDYFLNFNYTSTLESIYKLNTNKICHIHGYVLDSAISPNIIIGHNISDPDQLIGSNDIEVESIVDAIAYDSFVQLYKDTQKIINQHLDFFDKLKSVKEVYSYGFSYSDVDLNYVKKVIQSINNSKDSVWYIEEFPGQETIEKCKKIIKDNGFKGSITTF